MTLAAVVGAFWVPTALDRSLLGALDFSLYLDVGAAFATASSSPSRPSRAGGGGALRAGRVGAGRGGPRCSVASRSSSVLDHGARYLRENGLQTRLG